MHMLTFRQVLEVRAAAGGDEASLFAAEIFEMYHKFSLRNGWKFEVMSTSASEAGLSCRMFVLSPLLCLCALHLHVVASVVNLTCVSVRQFSCLCLSSNCCPCSTVRSSPAPFRCACERERERSGWGGEGGEGGRDRGRNRLTD